MFGTLPTPFFALDVGVFRSNVSAMADRARALGVGLRPHAKTVKIPSLLAEVVQQGAVGLTVSTLSEIRTLSSVSGDLLYAVGVAAGKSDAVLAAVGSADIRLTLAVDSFDGLAGVPDDPRVDVAVEIDCDGLRSGMAPDDPALPALVARLGDRFRGVFTHAGGSYLVAPDEVADFARRERDAVVRAAAECGVRASMVSAGSTPTAWTLDDATGLTEIRPGVSMVNDRSMVALGVAVPSSIAGSVIATVIGHSTTGDPIIDAGWAALGQDRGVPALGPNPGLGGVVGGGSVAGATQEHGRLTGVSKRTGERVRILPNHACATIEMHRRVVLVDGSSVVGEVDRPRGW